MPYTPLWLPLDGPDAGLLGLPIRGPGRPGYEVVEGAIRDGRIRELRRIDCAPGGARLSAQ